MNVTQKLMSLRYSFYACMIVRTLSRVSLWVSGLLEEWQLLQALNTEEEDTSDCTNERIPAFVLDLKEAMGGGYWKLPAERD